MHIRPVLMGDAASVLEVIRARDVADLGAPDYTRADLDSDWASSTVTLDADARVAELGGVIAGYAIMRISEALVIVHPEAVGKGIGSALLAWSEAREIELGRTRHCRSAVASDPAGGRLLNDAGYTKVRSYWRMRRPLDGPVTRTPVPDGMTLRPLEVAGDALTIHGLDQRSFAAVPDFTPDTFQAFHEKHLSAHDLDPGLSIVAEHAAGPVAFLLSHRWPQEDTGYVGRLAVGPEHRRRGLGRALLTAAFVAYAAAGLGIAELGVASDNPRALALYEQAGMTPRFQIDSYERGAR